MRSVSNEPANARREARAEDNRRLILDAAERVAGERGLAAVTVREIAAAAGFSPAALYLFFDNREQLLAGVMTRRGGELLAILEKAAAGKGSPLVRLHRIVDVTVTFFGEHPEFRGLLRQVNPNASLTGPALGAYANDPHAYFTAVMTLLADLVEQGQRKREIRSGSPRALAHFFSVLVNEQVFLGSESLQPKQFHALVDGALRRPG